MNVKGRTVTVSSFGDLVDVVNHNFDTFNRSLKKLAKSNRRLKVLCVIAVGYAIANAIEYRKQEEQVYQLSVRVKKLEQNEGE